MHVLSQEGNNVRMMRRSSPSTYTVGHVGRRPVLATANRGLLVVTEYTVSRYGKKRDKGTYPSVKEKELRERKARGPYLRESLLMDKQVHTR